MRRGTMYKFGTVILANIQFTDTYDIKTRPALILFEEYGNVVVAGITSNLEMDGIKLTKKDGAVKDSVIKLNYIFTISEKMVKKVLFSISEDKKKLFISEFTKKLKV
ncbi:type II toxin-antitoxin system PemK/MazF family toxin [Candidatus Woesearchaeota archaeon]|nr:type II toxin-antitoxin system PemK/MazF family toxin [Candidatus Woesearchaeota archaeon]